MKKKHMLLFSTMLIILSNIIAAQETPVIRDSLFSQILQEERVLEVKLPNDYKPESGTNYEVIYLLDGEWNIGVVPFIHGFARGEGFVPRVIFVGLPNTYIKGANQRDRDFLPGNAADKFIEFLEKEVIPFVENKYPANGLRTLYGHSYGGLFTTFAMLTKPKLFDAYLASDPAYHWNNGFMLNYAKEKLPSLKGMNKTHWMGTIQSTYKYMLSCQMDSIFQAYAPKDLIHKIGIYPNETHNSVRLKGVYDGLKFIYEGYSNSGVTFHPMNGIAVEGKPFPVMRFGNFTNVRYTIDGTEPTAASPKMDSLILVPGPAELKVKSFYSHGGNEAVTTGNFKDGETLASIPRPENVKAGGLNYLYHKGEWSVLPDFSKLSPVSSGIAEKDFNLDSMPDEINFGCLFDGYIEITREGYHIFILDSDDGSKLYFNNELILANDGLHGAGNAQTYMLPLERGFYPVRIEYFQRGGGRSLDLLYVPPGATEPVRVPFESLYYN